MGKLEAMEMVSEMTGLDYGYVVEAADYFRTYEEAFNWIYFSEESPDRVTDPESFIKQLSYITVEQMQELHANTVAEYMILDHRHTYITPNGIAYLRITR